MRSGETNDSENINEVVRNIGRRKQADVLTPFAVYNLKYSLSYLGSKLGSCLFIDSIAALGVRQGMEYREGKKYIPGAIRKLGIDPKDVSFFTYLRGIDIPGRSLLYGSSYHENQELQWEINDAKFEYFGGSKERDPEKFVEVLFKSMTPQERLGIIKKKERNKYQNSSVFQETFNIQPSSLVQG